MMKLNPLTKKKIDRFKSLKRGYFSFCLLSLCLLLSLMAEVLINSKALVVRYQGEYFFPVFSQVIQGQKFGLATHGETDYRLLQQKFRQQDVGILSLCRWYHGIHMNKIFQVLTLRHRPVLPISII